MGHVRNFWVELCVWAEPLLSSPPSSCSVSSATIPVWFPVYVHSPVRGHMPLIYPQGMSWTFTSHWQSIRSWLHRLQRWAVGGPHWQNLCHPYFPYFLVFSHARSTLVYSLLFWKWFWVKCAWPRQKVPSILSRIQENVSIFMEITKTRH